MSAPRPPPAPTTGAGSGPGQRPPAGWRPWWPWLVALSALAAMALISTGQGWLERDTAERLPWLLVAALLAVAAAIATRARRALGNARQALQAAEDRVRALEEFNATLGSRERFIHTLTDSQPALLSYWDRGLRCRFANRSYREWFGRSEAEMDGTTMRALVGDERAAEIEPQLAGLWRGEVLRAQPLMRGAAGKAMHAQVIALPDIVDGQVVGVLMLIFDISELKLAEQRLQQLNLELAGSRDKAEAATRAKSAFLANIGHEIRTPLNAILGLTHLLRRDAHDAVEEDRLDKVSDAAAHLLEMINDILDLSKIESGRFELEQVDFSPRELVGRNAELMAERARAKGLQLLTEVGPLPTWVLGDATRVSQALLNLLSNAVKFTDRGSVTLRVDCPNAAEAAPLLRFTVIDTGPGIEADKIGPLFDAFVQADASTTRRFGGTGLGLAITRRLAELMGGEVGVRSVFGEGSEFWFTARLLRAEPPRGAALPAGAAVLSLHGAESLLRQHHAGARVLLAEDNPVNQEVAVELLRAVGLEVDVAHNGAEALARARRQRYDLVLMDVQMPVMDGLDATRTLRALPKTASLPIVAMTADAFGEARRACLDAGMNGHLTKPVSPRLLYEALQRWLPAGQAGTPHDTVPATTASGSAAPGDPRDAAAASQDRSSPAGAWGPAREARAAPPAGIPGLDMTLAMRLLGGRVDVLRRALRQFEQHYADSLPELVERIEAGEADGLRGLAHSIRGASASIGAQSLAANAAAVEAAAGRAGLGSADLKPLGLALVRELESVIAAIRDHLGPDQTRPMGLGEDAVAPVVLDRLEQLLAQADYQAVALHREIADGLRAAYGPGAGTIATHLRRFEFGEALALLRELRQRQSP